MTTEKLYLTPGGQERLRRRLARARADYQAVCDDNPVAIEAGDNSGWHDNFAFEDNQRKMHQLARRIKDLEWIALHSEIVRSCSEPPGRVVLGSVVVLRFDDEDSEREIYLAGYDDGDPSIGRISYNSPLGRQILGTKPGDELEVRLAGGRRRLEIIDVLAAPVEEGRCEAD
jgi:transcription elongation factor GreA